LSPATARICKVPCPEPGCGKPVGARCFEVDGGENFCHRARRAAAEALLGPPPSALTRPARVPRKKRPTHCTTACWAKTCEGCRGYVLRNHGVRVACVCECHKKEAT
jgi:hypothetical protein